MSQLLLYEINENSYQHIYTYNMHTELENYLKSLIVYPAAVFHVKQHISIFASLVIKQEFRYPFDFVECFVLSSPALSTLCTMWVESSRAYQVTFQQFSNGIPLNRMILQMMKEITGNSISVLHFAGSVGMKYEFWCKWKSWRAKMRKTLCSFKPQPCPIRHFSILKCQKTDFLYYMGI